EQAASTLAEPAGDAPARRLGIGTGRLALALAARGVEVHGVDASKAMIERLQAKPGGDRIPVTVGDMADVPVDGVFSLVFVAFNTFFNLTDQDAQLRCMRAAAERLTPGGAFVLEAFVPDASRFEVQQSVSARTVEPDRVVLQVSRHDALAQTVDMSTVVITEAG